MVIFLRPTRLCHEPRLTELNSDGNFRSLRLGSRAALLGHWRSMYSFRTALFIQLTSWSSDHFGGWALREAKASHRIQSCISKCSRVGFEWSGEVATNKRKRSRQAGLRRPLGGARGGAPLEAAHKITCVAGFFRAKSVFGRREEISVWTNCRCGSFCNCCATV